MLFGHINEADHLDRIYPAAIAHAVRHLAQADFATAPVGGYSLNDDIRVQIIDTDTREVATTRPEVHKLYIDVHFVVRGSERIGFAHDTGEHRLIEEHPDRDLYFYEDAGPHEQFMSLRPGYFVVFFPWDVHRPACVDGAPASLRKVVVKVALRALEAHP
ncbi:MAG: YhcH/YjgK/YiaL family protein [Rhodocyclaceae bacterium]